MVGTATLNIRPTQSINARDVVGVSNDLCCPRVEQFFIGVESEPTVRAVLDDMETDSAASAAIREVLDCFPGRDSSLYLVDMLRKISLDDFSPGNDLSALERYSDRGSRLYELEKYGIVTDVDGWHEDSSGAYLSDGRGLTTFYVPRTVIPVEVLYHFPEYWSGRSCSASHWEITDTLARVPAGWYLLGETGDHRMSTVGVAYLGLSSDVPSDLVCYAAEVEGFMASRCDARCNSCESRWFAESGSWKFEPEYGCAADPWMFDDAEDFDVDDCVKCPYCIVGRVGFLVY
ncbi:hypothetical protein [Fodinicola acaciae]|uniref:hypothetical protein n=1 Tax=Fodinicola acaciae TaxID=2681555 RepID=UPI0013D45EEA|nr:hypothetical protein [Fodinicola acaciae]